MISKFHYLTQDLQGVSHQELVEIACKNGIRWIQLRVKNKSFDEHLMIAKEAKQITDKFEATLIINDNVEICKEINASGVHLGKNDMPIVEARKILGNTAIIGGTANTIEDIKQLQIYGANYIGLGPYKFTNTKKNLSPILGLQGYSTILQNCKTTIPIIAIGGIQIEDVQALMQTGIYGIAVSSAINLSENKSTTIKKILSLL